MGQPVPSSVQCLRGLVLHQLGIERHNPKESALLKGPVNLSTPHQRAKQTNVLTASTPHADTGSTKPQGALGDKMHLPICQTGTCLLTVSAPHISCDAKLPKSRDA